MKRLTSALPLVIAFASLGLVACGSAGQDGESDTQATNAASSALSASDRYIIKFKDYSRRGAVLSAAGAQTARELPSHAAVAAYIPGPALEGLRQNPNIEYIEADPKRELYGQTTPYGISMVQATDPAFTSAGGNVKVCIIDSGLYTGHEDFQGIGVTGEAGTAWNQDGCGHGTHVAGTITAADNTAGVVGVAPNSVSLHIVRVFGDDCSWSYASDLVAALDECQAAGAKVVSMSLGGTFKSTTENAAFASAYNAGVLSIAAAGNDGNTRMSYPASYDSVVSVAAIDSAKALASFSQRNSQVEVSAPGVSVLSSVPWTTPTLSVGGSSYMGAVIDGAATIAANGALVDGGLCDSIGSWSGKIVLCQRGTITFADKVNNVQAGGGVGAVIYNNVSGAFAGTLGTGVTSAIPAISMTQEDGQALVAGSLGQSATLNAVITKPGSGYEAWDGTSMATPHVSGVAALIWSYNPSWTNAQIRDALTATAEDLGAAGRDDSFGYGLVQAKAALDYLNAGGGGGGGGGTCGAAGASCSSNADCCSGSCGGKPNSKTCK